MERIMFKECINKITVGNMKYMHDIKYAALKQLSRARFEIGEEECIVIVKVDDEMISVIVDNSISVYELCEQTYSVSPSEPSLDFMRSKLNKGCALLVDALKDYKEKFYIRGDKLEGEIWYKIYSREPLVNGMRDLYHAKWVDYEEQLKNDDTIFDPDGLCGLWAMPARQVLDCLNEECKEHYGNRIFLVAPVVDCFYLNDGLEIIGDRYRVIDSMSLDSLYDIGRVCKSLMENEKRNNQKVVSERDAEIISLKRKKDAMKEDLEYAYYKERRGEKKVGLGIIIGILLGIAIRGMLKLLENVC